MFHPVPFGSIPGGLGLVTVMFHFRSHSWCRFGFGSVSARFRFGSYSVISQSRASSAVPSRPGSTGSASFGSGLVGGDFWFGQRQFRLHLASVLVVTPALLGVDLGLRLEISISSQIRFAAISVSYYIRFQSADATPSRPIPPFHLIPSRSIPFHPVPSRSVRFVPAGLVWLWLFLIFDITRGFGLVSVWFRFGFGLVSAWCRFDS